MTIIISMLVGVGVSMLPHLFPIKGETDSLGVLITYCKHSRWWKWLAWQLWRDEGENEYHERMWKRMQSRMMPNAELKHGAKNL